MPFGESRTDSPEQLKRQRRSHLYARFIFIVIALFLVAHRIASLWLAGTMADPAAQGPLAGAAGMVVIFLDPLGTLVYLALAKVVTGSVLNAAYVAATILMDSLLIYFFWRVFRYAFADREKAIHG